MARRTVYLPDSVDKLVRQMARKDESYSATLARLIEAASEALQGRRTPSYVGTGDGPDDLGRLAESYLGELVSARSKDREPGSRRARGSG